MLDTLRTIVNNKNVLILGYGREGHSTYEKLVLAGNCKSIAIADGNQVEAPEGVKVISGSDYQAAIKDFDVVFKSPGVVLDHQPDQYDCAIVSQTEVFFRHYRNQIVGITGTKGKSTTTTLLYHILKEAGEKTVLAGNIGIPVFDVADDIDSDTTIVVELSCHQLEYMTVSPRISVLMNLFEEHLDHYGTMEKYVAAKENVYRNQLPGDLLFCNGHNLPKEGTCKAKVVSVVNRPEVGDIVVGDADISYKGNVYKIPQERISLIGHHNYFDIGIVYGICQELAMDDAAFEQGLCTYETLPHRLQYIGTVNGVKYYDDSISTICETTIQALNSLPKAETVIIGGMDRGIEYDDLEDYLDTAHVKHVILMAATGHRIYDEINQRKGGFNHMERLVLVDTLEEAVAQAHRLTKPGETCVMSPAAASYGIFKNFEERGDVFKALVMAYKDK